MPLPDCLRRLRRLRLALALATALPTTALAQAAAPAHSTDWPALFQGPGGPAEIAAGSELQRGRPARALLADHRRLANGLAALQPQRKGVVDAYVVAIGLDSDPVFGREAREAGKVLARRYDAAGRTLVLGGAGDTAGSLHALTLALARVAELMDKREDVLVLYTTSHGAPVGLAYHDGDQGYGLLSPARLAAILDELGIANRMLLLSACYSGIFVQPLASDTTALVTAASSDRPSFGCQAENDWTFFGDALINRALRKPQPLDAAVREARDLIGGWEALNGLQPSNPQVTIGDGVAAWLAPLEARTPAAATAPVGKPATDMLKR